jgi:hypothetical protein
LLSDIRDIFSDEFPPGHVTHQERADDTDYDRLYGPRLPTKVLLKRLHELEERPWSAWGTAKKPMTDKAIGDLLRPYGVRSGTVRIGLSTSKGYYLRSFQDAFMRYLSLAPLSKRHTVTTPTSPSENESLASVTGTACDGSETAGNASKSAGCDGVTLQRGGEATLEGNDMTADDPGGGLIETLL